MYFSRRTCLLACLFLAFCSCSRRPANTGLDRIAILRFENLSADASFDWMGRALSEVITRELATAPGIYAIPAERFHRLETSFGARPVAAPGISAERTLALAAGANRMGYGDFSVRAERLEATLTIEDVQTGQMVQVLSASAAANDPVDAATSLARQISGQAAPYLTRSAAALQPYIAALESSDPPMKTQWLEQSIAADPNFAPAYSSLLQVKIQQGDRQGAQALLDQALAHGQAMPELERARLRFDAAGLRGDTARAGQALDTWVRAAPNDPAVWTAVGQVSMSHHGYAEAKQAYQKAVAIEPENVELLNQLGYAAAYAGDLNTATEALLRYQKLRPADVNPLDSLGDVNLLLGHLHESENFYSQAAKRDAAFLNGAEFFKAAMARLMMGDIAGADKLAQQFVDAHAAAKDPLVEYHRAQWDWVSGRRKEAVNRLLAFARNAERGPLREVASQAYGQLAVWEVALGDRSAAAPLAGKAIEFAGPNTAAVAVIARFLAQPSASAGEWADRAEHAFPSPAQKSIRATALAYALLADKEYRPAARTLEDLYGSTSPTVDDGLPVLLAWTWLETGKPKEAAALLRFNPLPSSSGVKPLSVFSFPRLFYLRSRAAALAGNAGDAHTQFQLFRTLSGDQALLWNEETHAP